MWKVIKNNFRILKKPHAYLQSILKAPLKFQKDRTKTVGGVKGTRYLLKIRNQDHAPRAMCHAPRKAENSVPLLFFKKWGGGDNKFYMGLKIVKKLEMCPKHTECPPVENLKHKLLRPDANGDRLTGQYFMPFQPFFEWQGHKNMKTKQILYSPQIQNFTI